MATAYGRTLLRREDPRWEAVNREQEADEAARTRGLTVAELLDRGARLSRAASDLRRAAWEAQRGRPAT
jgi:hypothetical protein